jgi:hypothetical protein
MYNAEDYTHFRSVNGQGDLIGDVTNFFNKQAQSLIDNFVSYGANSIMDSATKQNDILQKQLGINLETKTKSFNKVLGNQAMSYVKSGVGVSGSALDVINYSRNEMFKELLNDVDYGKAYLKDNILTARNKAISSVMTSEVNKELKNLNKASSSMVKSLGGLI